MCVCVLGSLLGPLFSLLKDLMECVSHFHDNRDHFKLLPKLTTSHQFVNENIKTKVGERNLTRSLVPGFESITVIRKIIRKIIRKKSTLKRLKRFSQAK